MDVFKFDHAELKAIIEKIKDYEDVKSLIRIMDYRVSNKLRLYPDRSINNRLSHLHFINDYCIEQEGNVYGFESLTAHETSTDFDVLIKSNDGFYELIDFTHDAKLAGEKARKMSRHARALEEEMKARNVEIRCRGVSLVIVGSKQFSVKFTMDDKSEFQQSYSIINSITENNINRLLPLCQGFLDVYKHNLITTTKCEKQENIHLIESDASNWAKIAKSNDVETLTLYSQMESKNIKFLELCKEACGRLGNFLDTNKVRQATFQFQLPSAKDNLISNKLTDNPIIGSLETIKSLGITGKFYETSLTKPIREVLRPTEQFSGDKTILTARLNKDHSFEIYFNKSHIDSSLIDSIIRSSTKDADKRAPIVSLEKDYFLKDQDTSDNFTRAESVLKEISDRIRNMMVTPAKNSIFSKMEAILDSNKRTTKQGMDEFLSDAAKNLVMMIKESIFGYMIEFEHEIAKAFATTINFAKTANCYDLLDISSFDAKILRQRNASLEQFANSFYIVFYNKKDNRIDLDSRAPFRVTNNVVQSKSSSFNRNTLSWAMRKSHIFFMFLSWIIENKSNSGNSHSVREACETAYHICSINRDQFAQASEQVRYLYVSTTGRNSLPDKIINKFDSFRPKRLYEIVYLIRSIKMAASLYMLRISHNLTRLRTRDDDSGILAVSFPHDRSFILDFNYTISSFYICNIFNKFRYNNEVSQAHCYNGLLEEHEIFKEAKRTRSNELLGISESVVNSKTTNFEVILTEFAKDEMTYALSVSRDKPQRFSYSLTLVLSLMISKKAANGLKFSDKLHNSTRESPLNACTLRGGMLGSAPTKERQSARAATVVLEGILKAYGEDPEEFNKNDFVKQSATYKLANKDVSLSTLCLLDYNNKREYAFRTNDKDQKGHREISVLNYHMRIGAKFVEQASRDISSCFKSNVLEVADKGIVMQTLVKNSLSYNDKDHICVYDNNDQQRWGPNHLVTTFYAMLKVFYVEDEGLCALFRSIFKRYEGKIGKYPENLIDKLIKGYNYREGTTMGDFMHRIKGDVMTGVYGKRFEWGMLQGILHETSSVYHSIVAELIEEILIDSGHCVAVQTLITSDDGFRAMKVPKTGNFEHETSSCVNLITRAAAAFNIIRSPAKSTLNTIVAEFNSDFYVEGRLYVPSLKQRISKVDCGSGEDYIEDVSAACASAIQYYTAGGTYFGTFLLMLSNVTQVTEQWRRWYQFKTEHSIDKSVFSGGIPIISPVMTLMGGPIANIFIKELIRRNVEIDDLTKYFAAIATSDEEFVTQTELIRGNSIIPKDEFFSYVKPVSLSGFINLTKPTAHASRLLKRHKLNQLILPDLYVSLDQNLHSFNSLIMNIAVGTGSNSLEEILGTNSYIKRFAEPYFNIDSERFRISKMNAISSILGLPGDKKSLRDIENLYARLDSEQIISRSMIDATSTASSHVMQIVNHVSESIKSAYKIAMSVYNKEFKVLDKIHTPGFRISKLLTNQMSILDDETYKLSAFKSIYGEKAWPIIRGMGWSRKTFDELINLTTPKSNNLIDSIMYSKKTSDVFNKYLKFKTKGVIKAMDISKDKFEMMVSSIFYNFSSRISLKPPKIDLPTVGVVIRICRLSQNSELATRIDEYRAARTLNIFQAGEVQEREIYYETNDGQSLGDFEVVNGSLRICDKDNDSCMIINRASENRIRKRIESLMPTSTKFKFTNKALTDLDFDRITDNHWVRHNSSFMRKQNKEKLPFTFTNCIIKSYVLVKSSGDYIHTVLVQPQSLINTFHVDVDTSRPEEWIRHVSRRVGSSFSMTRNTKFQIAANDYLVVTAVLPSSVWKLEYSSTSMNVCMKVGLFSVPFLLLNMVETHPMPIFECEEVKPKELKVMQDYIRELFNVAITDKEISYYITESFNMLSIPIEKENVATFISRIISINILDEDEEDVFELAQIKQIENFCKSQPRLFVFLMITNFKLNLNVSYKAIRDLRYNNFSKCFDLDLFSDTILLKQHDIREINEDNLAYIERTEKKVSFTENITFELEEPEYNEDDEFESDDEIEFGDDLFGGIVSGPNVLGKMLDNASIQESLPPVNIEMTPSEIFDIDASIYQDDDVIIRDISYTELSMSASRDKEYLDNAYNLVDCIVQECEILLERKLRPKDFWDLLCRLNGNRKILSQIISISSRYMDLDRLALIMLTTF